MPQSLDELRQSWRSVYARNMGAIYNQGQYYDPLEPYGRRANRPGNIISDQNRINGINDLAERTAQEQFRRQGGYNLQAPTSREAAAEVGRVAREESKSIQKKRGRRANILSQPLRYQRPASLGRITLLGS